MNISPITRLTLRWLEVADREAANTAKHDLINLLESAGNTQDQTDHWLCYAPEMTALEGETLAEVIETEACMAKLQGRIK